MDGASNLLGVVGVGISGVIGAWALLVRAKGDAAKTWQLLRRLVDWLQAEGMWDHVPTFLRSEIEKHIMEDGE